MAPDSRPVHLVVPMETKVETHNTLYDEIAAQLRVLARAKARTRA